MSSLRILVCGGRDYRNKDRVWCWLDNLRDQYGCLTIIQGGAGGADELAREWAINEARQGRRAHLINEPADWTIHGRAAGPIRNQRMLDEHKPELVVAFPGGKGTADMVRRARAAGIKVIEVEG